ncbi:MAG: sodium:solute symporter family protein [Deltaproteobacteria bacterium]|nr:sodium:solute symporter family protein [Deltaproteobacteria bacterium]
MNDLPLGPGAMAILALYALSLIAVGFWGRMRRAEETLEDHYLAGRGLGLSVLLLTLFATQYSGNTLFGFTGKAYRIGFPWLMSVHAMMTMVVGYLVFAPRLQRLARKWNLITPGDYLLRRFGSHPLRILATLCMVYALANYTLAQLKVMGHAVAGLSGGRIDPFWGVVVLAVIMVLYETLGGMRSVAWTDAVQGLLLFFGFGLLLYLAWTTLGGLPTATAKIVEQVPKKAAVPDASMCVYWLSMVVLVGIGGSVYPQAIQRIFAAKSGQTLRRSLAFMSVMPLVTTGAVLVLGIIAIPLYPGLDATGSDQVLALVLRDVMTASTFGYWTVVVLLAAVVAALMSTADSALLSISSMVVKDLYGPYLRKQATEEHLTNVGKIVSWVVIAVLVYIATLEELTLVRLLEIKFEVLIQVAPALYLGTTWRKLDGRSVLAGMVVGLTIALGLWALQSKPLGFHPGVLGLFANTLVTVALGLRAPRPATQR